MSAPAWPRPQWRDSGAHAFVLWFVFGDFDPDLSIDAVRYRTRGTPAGVSVVRYVNRELARWDGYPLAGTLGRLLWEENAPLFEKAQGARECVMLRGEIADPADLDALRDLVGTIAALNDAGGIAVVDPQTLSLFAAADWRARFFAADRFNARDHVLILCGEDDRNEGRMHVHTRGLRKFARPDLSVRNVPPAAADAAGAMTQQFAEFACAGGLVEDGHEVALEDAPPLRARLAGSDDDPEFNNVHLAMRWPD